MPLLTKFPNIAPVDIDLRVQNSRFFVGGGDLTLHLSRRGRATAFGSLADYFINITPTAAIEG